GEIGPGPVVVGRRADRHAAVAGRDDRCGQHRHEGGHSPSEHLEVLRVHAQNPKLARGSSAPRRSSTSAYSTPSTANGAHEPIEARSVPFVRRDARSADSSSGATRPRISETASPPQMTQTLAFFIFETPWIRDGALQSLASTYSRGRGESVAIVRWVCRGRVRREAGCRGGWGEAGDVRAPRPEPRKARGRTISLQIRPAVS